jgi:hypothetical protein
MPCKLTVTILEWPFLGVVFETPDQTIGSFLEHEQLTSWLETWISPLLLSRSDWTLLVEIKEDEPDAFPKTLFPFI